MSGLNWYTNAERADRGRATATWYAGRHGIGGKATEVEPETVVSDMFADMLHAYGPDFIAEALSHGTYHYEAEVVEEAVTS